MKKISITAKLRKSSTDTNHGTICYQVTYNRKTSLLSTGIRICLHEWDKHSSLPTDTNLQHKVTSDITTLQAIAERLKNSALSSPKDIIDSYTRNKGESLLDYIQLHIQHLYSNHRNGTATKYRSLQHSLSIFSSGNTIALNDLDKSIVPQYNSFLLTRKLCRNTISFYMRLLRTILRKAYNENRLASDPTDWFQCVYTGYDRTKKRAIEISLLRRIACLNLSGKPKPTLARDVYLFSFYARGMAFVDIANLRKTDISEGYIRYYRKKTGQLIKIELLDKMKQITTVH